MDILNLKNNDTYYKDFEDDCEPEITISLKENPEFNIHIWEGYISDIFGKPYFDEDGWKGFTKDYHEGVRSYDTDEPIKINVDEYLNDIQRYKSNKFRFEETKDCYELIIEFLKYAKENNKTVLVYMF